MAEEFDLANVLAQKVSEKVLDKVLPAALDPILGVFGLDGASSDDVYFQQITQRLDQIQVSLDQLAQRMIAMDADMSEVRKAEIGISMQLQDNELQSLLDLYASDANFIEQNFQTYSATLKMMTEPKQIRGPISNLFKKFDVNNLDAVATAMRNIHARFVGAGEMKGLISYQGDICKSSLSDWAAGPNNLLTYSPGDWFWVKVLGEDTVYSTSGWSYRVPDGNKIATQWMGAYTTAIASKIIPTFKSILAVQLKGLLFLSAGWGNSQLQTNLSVHVTNIIATIKAMSAWWSTVDPNPAVSDILQLKGPRLQAGEIAGPWAHGNVPGLPYPGPPTPFDNDWVLWVASQDNGGNSVALVHKPWALGTCTAAFGVWNKDTFGDGSHTYHYTYSAPFSSVNVNPAASKPEAPPDVLVQFLAGLPTDSSQLNRSGRLISVARSRWLERDQNHVHSSGSA